MKQTARVTPGLIILILLLLVLLNGSALAWLGWPALQQGRSALPITAQNFGQDTTLPSDTPVAAQTLTPSSLPATSTFTPVPLSIGNPQAVASMQDQGVLLLALRDGGQVHLFAYHPDLLSLTRLTDSSWDEIHPAISPDGKRLAYSSRENGYWDLFIRELETGKTERITDTPEYEGSPSWSPDGEWLAYDAYRNDNLDIYVLSLSNPGQAHIKLTDDQAADSSPAWSPGGRQIAFVSNRGGEADIWLADLDRTENRFTNLSQKSDAADTHPVWSADGLHLAWASELAGEHSLMVWSGQPIQPASIMAVQAGYGDWPAWSPQSDLLFSGVRHPNQQILAAYALGNGLQRMPPIDLPGEIYGMEWKSGPLTGWLWDAINRADNSTHSVMVQPILTLFPGSPHGRMSMVALQDVSAPQAMIHDGVDEAFLALRQEAASVSGWDVLSSLENAYIPLTSPPEPSLHDDWLYTGRAFSLNPLILSAGWMTAVREDFNGQTYWRLYLKAHFQDGSAGIPMTLPAWDINARFSGDPAAYETGGQPGSVQPGYWVDLTEMAARYGWERLPARSNWRTFFPGIRFNQFVIRGGLDWNQAMAEIYPPEALQTPTSIPTYTNTPTFTLVPTRTRVVRTTPTPIPSATPTPPPTLVPTLTLIPTGSQ